MVLFFVERRAELERRFERLVGALDPAGALWIGWPKRSSGVETSVPEDDPTHEGAVLFAERCSGCHTMSAAGTT
jgi:mono/diheme cytochrome c family protein